MDNYVRKTSLGLVQGYVRGGAQEYLGIPYAKPPVGELRFKRAVANDPWEGVFDAKEYGPCSCQMGEDPSRHATVFKGSEDCLTLNVKTPEDAKEGDKLPVYFWIHGGGYNSGAASDELFTGHAFEHDGIIVVTIQYRLNVLGFYDFTTYKDGKLFDSNCGLSDMVCALTWVHENIAAFGGDPDNITIGGESAGGGAVLTLMAVPAVKGMFKKVIAESGVPVCLMTKEIARRNMDLFLEGMGMTEDDIPRLLTMPAEDMQKGNSYVGAMHQYRNPGIFLPSPVIDDLLPMHPIEAIASGSAADVSLILGTNMHEGSMFVRGKDTNFPNSWAMIAEMFQKNGCADRLPAMFSYYDPKRAAGTGEVTVEALKEMTDVPADIDTGVNSEGAMVFIDFATDHAFKTSAIKAADAQLKNNPNVWMYRYEYCSEACMQTGLGASHAFELPAVFGEREFGFTQFIFAGHPEHMDHLISEIHGRWVRFMKTGDPGEEWGRYAGHVTPIRYFDENSYTKETDLTPLTGLWDRLKFYEE